MKNAFLNFLATRAGAVLAPLVLMGAGWVVHAVALHFPWAAPYVTTENVIGAVMILGMIAVNYLTNARGFKYGLQVQAALNLIGARFGYSINEDGVVAHQTATAATLIATRVRAVAAAQQASAGPVNPSVQAILHNTTKG